MNVLTNVEGIVTADKLADTVDAIAAIQLPDGNIPWVPGHHTDPWNLIEAAMALDVGGRHTEAERAYEWLRSRQRPDGAWHAYYVGDDVKDPTLDTNVTAYIANGAWHHYLSTPRPALPRRLLARGRARHRLRARLPDRDGRGRVAGRRSRRRRPAHRVVQRPCQLALPRSRSRSTSAMSAPTGSCHSAPSRSPSRTGPTSSSTRRAGRWTGTTRSSVASSGATPPTLAWRRDGRRSWSKAGERAASPTARGSRPPRRASS